MNNALTSLLYGAIALLLIDSIAELGFIVTTVRYLNTGAAQGFLLIDKSPSSSADTTKIRLRGKPLHFLLNQGHTANGAAGCCFIIIGIGGFFALWLRSRQLNRTGGISGFTKVLYQFWLYMTAVSAIFTLAALVYVFVETNSYFGQQIDVALAIRTAGSQYPRGQWTPQNWFPAILELGGHGVRLEEGGAVDSLKAQLQIARAWQWNLIPMVLLSVAVSVTAFVDQRRRRGNHKANGAFEGQAIRQKKGISYA